MRADAGVAAALCTLFQQVAAGRRMQPVLASDVAPRNLESETPALPCETQRSCGIVMQLYVDAQSQSWLGDRPAEASGMIAELVLAMRVLRVAMGQFGYPTLLAANAAARALLSTAETMLWDEHSELVLEPALAALDRTLERKRGLRKRKAASGGRTVAAMALQDASAAQFTI